MSKNISCSPFPADDPVYPVNAERTIILDHQEGSWRILVTRDPKTECSRLEAIATINGIHAALTCDELSHNREAGVRATLRYRDSREMKFHYAHHFYSEAPLSPFYTAVREMRAMRKHIEEYATAIPEGQYPSFLNGFHA